MVSAFTTRYYFNIIVMKEKGERLRRTFSRKHGYQFGISPGLAATAVEKLMAKRGFVIESITLRLNKEDGEIVLQTDIDVDKPYPEGGSREEFKAASESVWDAYKEKNKIEQDYWRYLTFVNMVKQAKVKFNVKEHMK